MTENWVANRQCLLPRYLEGKPNDCGFSFSLKSNATADQNKTHLIRLRESFLLLEYQHLKVYLPESVYVLPKHGTRIKSHQNNSKKWSSLTRTSH